MSRVAKPTDQGADPLVAPTGGGSPAPNPNHAIAMRYGDLASSDAAFLMGQANMQHTGQVPYTPDPDSTVLFFGTLPQPCDAPILGPSTPESDLPAFTQVVIVVPPTLNRTGLVRVADWRIFFYMAFEQEGYRMATFAWPGGWGGTLELGDLSGVSFTSTLDTSTPGRADGDEHVASVLNGTYEVTRCGPPTLTAPPTSGVAIWGGTSATSANANAFDADSLYFFAGTAAESCADPLTHLDGTLTERATFTIPRSRLAPGVLPLADIDGAYVASYPHVPEAFRADVIFGRMPVGTVEILSADDSAVSFRIDGSATGPEGGLTEFDADGLYAVSICP